MRASSKQICTMIVLRGPGHTPLFIEQSATRFNQPDAKCLLTNRHFASMCSKMALFGKTTKHWCSTATQCSKIQRTNVRSNHKYRGLRCYLCSLNLYLCTHFFKTLMAGAQPNVLKRRYMASAKVCKTQPK